MTEAGKSTVSSGVRTQPVSPLEDTMTEGYLEVEDIPPLTLTIRVNITFPLCIDYPGGRFIVEVQTDEHSMAERSEA